MTGRVGHLLLQASVRDGQSPAQNLVDLDDGGQGYSAMVPKLLAGVDVGAATGNAFSRSNPASLSDWRRSAGTVYST
jgi:hypothetical protein